VLLAFTDNAIKNRIENDSIKNGKLDKNGLFEIEKHHNKGLPLNKLDNHTKEITAVSAAILGAHAANTVNQALNGEDVITDTANTLILAGALSNTYDRVSKGYVTDYLKVGKKKRAIYNISDFFILGGAAIILLRTFTGVLVDGVRILISRKPE